MRAIVIAIVALAGCLEAAVTTCPDGTLCPADQVCAPAGGDCVDQAQLDAWQRDGSAAYVESICTW